MVTPYKITDVSDILTDPVKENLQIVFRQFGLSKWGVHVNLADGNWQEFSLFPPGEKDKMAEASFCSYARETKSFADLCAKDRETCRKSVMKNAGEPVRWTCPFGLNVMGIGFRVGDVEVLLRSSGWLEQGNEGIAITRTINILKSRLDEKRSEVLSRFKGQLNRSEADVQRDTKSLKGLLGLVRNQAQAQYRSNVEQSKEEFLQELRQLVVPLMAESDEQKQGDRIREALGNVMAFFSLEGCAFYFTKPGDRTWLTRIGASGHMAETIGRRIPCALLDARGPRSVGSAWILGKSELTGLSNPLNRACAVKLPDQNAALLVGWPVSEKDVLLDDRMLSEIARTLSDPIYMAFLGTELRREAELRRLQARNTGHTVRSVFQGIAGDAADIRGKIISVMGSLSSVVQEPLEHMEELIVYMAGLLRCYEIVESQFLLGTRELQFGRKKQVKVWGILAQAREGFRKRADELFIQIALDVGIRDLSPVEVDERAVSLAFLNLLHNALKYSHHGSPSKKKTINVTGLEDGSYVYIGIEDFGLGIHPAEEEKIFAPYVQGSVVDATRPIGGQGIGLAAAREIARMHGGDIILERCIPYRRNGQRIPRHEVIFYKPNSPEASELLQHCLVAFEVSLPKGR